MSRTERQYSIRFSAAGKQQLEADLRALGTSGERSLRLIQGAARPAGAGLRETDLAARQLKGSLNSVAAELPALQRLARYMGSTAIAGGLVAFGKGALDVGRQFQAMMQRVQAATAATEQEAASLEAAAKRLGGTTAFTAMQAAEAIEVLAKNGVAVSSILGGALDASLSLASALGAELAPSADLVTDLMAQFSLEASALPDVVDRVTGAAFTSKFGFDDLRLAIGQAGGVAGTAGVELTDFLTSLSATASNFSSGQDAGTSFKTFVQRLTPESKQAAAAMQELGLEFFDARGNMKTMAEIAGELQEGLAGLSDEARNEALKTIFGTDAIRTATALAKTGAEGFRELASAISEVSAEEQAAVRLRGLDGALKELASAWEALQLQSAQSGGLEIAEEAVRRLTDALRFLTENFDEVQEVVERVAQALAVYLVGKGMTLAIAKGVAMRASLIEIAGATAGVGTAASRAVGPLTRLGLAGRLLMGTLGGPLSLALTAASLVSLGIDTDTAADAIGRAETSAQKAADALLAYQDASKRAADEQANLGGKVSEATQQMLTQSRAALVQAVADIGRELEQAQRAMGDSLLDSDGFDDFAARYRVALGGGLQTGNIGGGAPSNRYLAELAKMAEQAGKMEISASKFAAAFERVQAVGPGLEEVSAAMAELLGSGGSIGGSETLSAITELAERTGLFGDELAALSEAGSEADLRRAFEALMRAMNEAVVAGKQVRSEQLEGFRENVAGLVEVESKQKELTEQLGEIEGLQESLAAQRPFDGTAESAREAAEEVDRLNRAGDAYLQYQESRSQAAVLASRSGVAAAKDLIRDKEDFRADAYPDWSYKNGKRYNSGWRAGYGSDTYTTPDGRAHQVAEGMTITRAQAELDLDRRIALYFDKITAQIGEMAFSALSDDQKGSLASLLHNYGENEFRAGGDLGGVVSALRGGNSQAVADAIGGLAGHNNGINEKRRLEEAAAFGSASSAEAALARADALKKVVEAGAEQLEQLRLEAELAGQSVEAQARLTYQAEALRRAKESGIDAETTLTEDGRKLVDVINEQAEAYGKLMAARDEADKRRENSGDEDQDRMQRIEEYRQEMSRLFDNLKPGGNGWSGFIDDFQTYLLDKLWELALDPVWQQLALLMDQAFGAIGPGGTLATSGAGATSGYSGSAGAMTSGGLYSTGGPLPRRAGGGGFRQVPRAVGMLQGPGSKKQDNLLFWGSRGEFMQPAAAVDYYGLEFMEKLRRREIPKFAEGGALPGASAGSTGGVTLRQGDVVVNNFAGVEVEQRRDAAGNLALDLRRAVSDMISSGGADAALQSRFNLKKTPRGR